MDPLLLLREYQMANALDQVEYNEKTGLVEFGDRYSFTPDTFTSYRSKGGRGDFYTLSTILFWLKRRHLEHAQYLKQAVQAQVPSVVTIDRKDLESYLTGQTEASECIVLPADMPMLGKRAGDAVDGSTALKRVKSNDAAADGEVAVERSAAAVEAAVVKEAGAHERQLRDRNTMLSVPGKNFLQFAKGLLEQVNENQAKQRRQQRLEQQRKAEAAAAAQRAPRPAVKESLPVLASRRHERDVQTNQLGVVAGAEFANLPINVYGTAASMPQPKSNAAAPSPPPQPPSQPPLPNAASSAGRHASSQHKSAHSSRSSKPDSHSRHKSSSSSQRGSSSGGGIPIIMVPTGLTSTFNMYNVGEFLQNGVYRDVESCRAAGQDKRSLFVLQREKNGKKIPYHVTDKPPPKNSKDWQCVVAVIVQGVQWQFKEWTFSGADKGDLVDTFSNVCGFYIGFGNRQTPEVVKKWNVHHLELDPNNRHSDLSVKQQFFAHLDKFLERKQCKLAY